MTSRTRTFVLVVSIPVIAFAVIGGYLGQALAKDDTYQHLRVFEDVVSLVLNNYVEEVDVSEAMKGAMKGLADGLDPDSAYLTPELVRTVQVERSGRRRRCRRRLSRVSTTCASCRRGTGRPRRRPGCGRATSSAPSTTGPTRDMSAYEGARLLHGAPGSQGVAARHPRQRRRPAHR